MKTPQKSCTSFSSVKKLAEKQQSMHVSRSSLLTKIFGFVGQDFLGKGVVLEVDVNCLGSPAEVLFEGQLP